MTVGPEEGPGYFSIVGLGGRWWVIPLVLVVAGCTTTEDVKIDDRVFFSSLRLTHDLSDAVKTKENENNSRVAAELDLHHASGTGSQSLGASQLIDFGGIQFTGPAQVEEDYDLLAASLAIRVGLGDPTDRSRIAVLLGLSIQDFDLHVEAGSVSAQDDRRSIGPLLGAEGSLAAYSWLDLYGWATQAIGFSDATSTLGLVELGLSVKPYSHVAVAGGYRWERYTQPRLLTQMMGFDETRIDLKLRGSVVGLHIDF